MQDHAPKLVLYMSLNICLYIFFFYMVNISMRQTKNNSIASHAGENAMSMVSVYLSILLIRFLEKA